MEKNYIFAKTNKPKRIDFMTELLLSFIVSLTIVLLFMPPFIALMTKYKILDKSGGRKIHERYTAHMGGLIIYLGFVISLILITMLYIKDIYKSIAIYFFIITFLMLFIGARDDLHNIRAKTKLFFEIIIGFLISYAGIRLKTLYGICGIYDIPAWFSYFLTICFFIVVTNAYNLIDGIDGQAGLQAVNVFIFLAFVCGTTFYDSYYPQPISHAKMLMIIYGSMLGALVGFLRYNWQKASIFMGDTGSLFVGTIIAICIIIAMRYSIDADMYAIKNHRQYTLCGFAVKSFIAPFICLFYIPLADTLRVFVYRITRHRSPFFADKTHIHHLFIRLGYSHQRCALTIFFISFFISVLGIVLSLLVNDTIFFLIIILSWFLYVFILHTTILRKIEKIEKNMSIKNNK